MSSKSKGVLKVSPNGISFELVRVNLQDFFTDSKLSFFKEWGKKNTYKKEPNNELLTNTNISTLRLTIFCTYQQFKQFC